MNNPEFIDLLERFIDANSVQDALGLLSSICWEKASHALSAWGDKELARCWERCAASIDKLSVSQAILALP